MTSSNQKQRLAFILECALIFFEKPKEIQELIQGEEEIHEAIAILQQNKTQDEELDIRWNKCLIPSLNNFLFCVGQLAIVATLVSYLGSTVCGNSQSKMCKDFHLIPDMVHNYTHEPKTKVLPPFLP